jgi:hypothetical protein
LIENGEDVNIGEQNDTPSKDVDEGNQICGSKRLK